jgi:tetratricopeptide (TPR) repeat protein
MFSFVALCAMTCDAVRAADVPGRVYHLMDRGVYLESISILENHLRVAPDDQEALILLARAFEHTGRFHSAADCLLKFLNVNPTDPAARQLLADIRLESEREGGVEAARDPLWYARLCLRTQNYDRAIEIYRQYVRDHGDPETRVEYARILGWAGRYEESAMRWTDCLSITTNRASVLHERGRMYNSAGRYSDAMSDFREALKAMPSDEGLLCDAVRSYLWSQRIAEGKDLITSLASIATPEIGTLEVLAGCHAAQGRADLEWADWSHVLKLDPFHETARLRLAQMEKNGDREIYVLRNAVTEEPLATDRRVSLIQALLRLNRLGEADAEIRNLHGLGHTEKVVIERVESARRRAGENVLAQLREARRSEQSAGAKNAYGSADSWLERNPDDQRTRALALHQAGATAQDALSEGGMK